MKDNERYQQSSLKLGCDAIITIVSGEDCQKLFIELWKQVDKFEDRFSRFKSESELTKINAKSGQRVDISKEMSEILNEARKYNKITGGIYNPMILPGLQKAGYVVSWPKPNSDIDESLDYSDRNSISFSEVELDSKSIRLPRNSALDFGGIGKGFLLDKLADYLESRGYRNYWISLGGDIIFGGFDLNQKSWVVRVDDFNNGGDLLEKELAGFSNMKVAATSSTTKRKGQGWHHIIDPRTNLPAKSSIIASTVFAKEGVMADIFAKTILIGGEAMAKDLAKKYSIEYILQFKDKKIVKSF